MLPYVSSSTSLAPESSMSVVVVLSVLQEQLDSRMMSSSHNIVGSMLDRGFVGPASSGGGLE